MVSIKLFQFNSRILCLSSNHLVTAPWLARVIGSIALLFHTRVCKQTAGVKWQSKCWPVVRSAWVVIVYLWTPIKVPFLLHHSATIAVQRITAEYDPCPHNSGGKMTERVVIVPHKHTLVLPGFHFKGTYSSMKLYPHSSSPLPICPLYDQARREIIVSFPCNICIRPSIIWLLWGHNYEISVS